MRVDTMRDRAKGDGKGPSQWEQVSKRQFEASVHN